MRSKASIPVILLYFWRNTIGHFPDRLFGCCRLYGPARGDRPCRCALGYMLLSELWYQTWWNSFATPFFKAGIVSGVIGTGCRDTIQKFYYLLWILCKCNCGVRPAEVIGSAWRLIAFQFLCSGCYNTASDVYCSIFAKQRLSLHRSSVIALFQIIESVFFTS